MGGLQGLQLTSARLVLSRRTPRRPWRSWRSEWQPGRRHPRRSSTRRRLRQGAEDSLLRRLETVRSQKAKALNKADSKDNDSGYPASGHDENPKAKDRKPRGAQPKTKPEPAQTLNSSGSESSGMDAVEDPKRIPKKATKRANAKDAELQEAQAKDEETWTRVEPPQPGA